MANLTGRLLQARQLSGRRPVPESGAGHSLEVLARCTTRRLHGHALRDRHDVAGDQFRVGVGGQVALCDSRLALVAQVHLLWARHSVRVSRATCPVSPTASAPCTPRHPVGIRAGCGLAPSQRGTPRPPRGRVGARNAWTTLRQDLPCSAATPSGRAALLVAEGRVPALAGDTHGFGQGCEAGTLATLPPEDHHRLLERRLGIERSRPRAQRAPGDGHRPDHGDQLAPVSLLQAGAADGPSGPRISCQGGQPNFLPAGTKIEVALQEQTAQVPGLLRRFPPPARAAGAVSRGWMDRRPGGSRRDGPIRSSDRALAFRAWNRLAPSTPGMRARPHTGATARGRWPSMLRRIRLHRSQAPRSKEPRSRLRQP